MKEATRGGLEPPGPLRDTGLATLRHTGLGYLVSDVKFSLISCLLYNTFYFDE